MNKPASAKNADVGEVIAMLGEVEHHESQLLNIIFEGKHHEASQLRKSIAKKKHRFKTSCHAIVSDLHRSDYDKLNRGMVVELERHFDFWQDKIAMIHDEAGKAIENLDNLHQSTGIVFGELQQNMHSLMPKCDKQLKEYKDIEMQLLNMNE